MGKISLPRAETQGRTFHGDLAGLCRSEQDILGDGWIFFFQAILSPGDLGLILPFQDCCPSVSPSLHFMSFYWLPPFTSKTQWSTLGCIHKRKCGAVVFLMKRLRASSPEIMGHSFCRETKKPAFWTTTPGNFNASGTWTMLGKKRPPGSVGLPSCIACKWLWTHSAFVATQLHRPLSLKPLIYISTTFRHECFFRSSCSAKHLTLDLTGFSPCSPCFAGLPGLSASLVTPCREPGSPCCLSGPWSPALMGSLPSVPVCP